MGDVIKTRILLQARGSVSHIHPTQNIETRYTWVLVNLTFMFSNFYKFYIFTPGNLCHISKLYAEALTRIDLRFDSLVIYSQCLIKKTCMFVDFLIDCTGPPNCVHY